MRERGALPWLKLREQRRVHTTDLQVGACLKGVAHAERHRGEREVVGALRVAYSALIIEVDAEVILTRAEVFWQREGELKGALPRHAARSLWERFELDELRVRGEPADRLTLSVYFGQLSAQRGRAPIRGGLHRKELDLPRAHRLTPLLGEHPRERELVTRRKRACA